MQGKNYDYLLKVVMIGDPDVGKSCMLLSFSDGTFTDSYLSTIGVDFRHRVLKLEDRSVKVQVWDTAGHERYRTITTAYYRGANAIVLVYDVTQKESFNHVADWLCDVRKVVPESLVVLAANKIDLCDRVVSTKEGESLAEELGTTYIEVSAKTGANIDQLFRDIAYDRDQLTKPSEIPLEIPIEQKSTDHLTRRCC